MAVILINPQLQDRLSVAPCIWGDDEQLAALMALGGDDGAGFDVVLACEVVYKQEEETLRALAATQHALSRRDGSSTILLAYEFRGELFDDMAYFDAVRRHRDAGGLKRKRKRKCVGRARTRREPGTGQGLTTRTEIKL